MREVFEARRVTEEKCVANACCCGACWQLWHRLTIAAIVFVLGAIMYAIQPGVRLLKVELRNWANFLAWTFLLELLSAVANDIVFVLIDVIIGKRAWHVVYAMLCADGPLGFFLWVLLSQAVSPWNCAGLVWRCVTKMCVTPT